jgi:hypothetical protein
MKKINLVFAVAICAVAFCVSASAQSAVDYSGTWVLDLSKSKLDERMRIESMTLTVAQTSGDITITGETKRTPPPADAMAAGGGAPRRAMGPEAPTRYTLDGKETRLEVETPRGKIPQTLSATIDGGKLSLSKTSTFPTPQGDMTQVTKEAWSLSPDGKTLTIVRDQSSPRGSASHTFVFVKK